MGSPSMNRTHLHEKHSPSVRNSNNKWRAESQQAHGRMANDSKARLKDRGIIRDIGRYFIHRSNYLREPASINGSNFSQE
jgi:hypothetical protein